jgi:hypothetical protein
MVAADDDADDDDDDDAGSPEDGIPTKKCCSNFTENVQIFVFKQLFAVVEVAVRNCKLKQHSQYVSMEAARRIPI